MQRDKERGGKTAQQHHQQRRSEGGGESTCTSGGPIGRHTTKLNDSKRCKIERFLCEVNNTFDMAPKCSRRERDRAREIAKNKYRIMHDIYTYIVCMLYICRMAQPEVCRPRGGSALLCSAWGTSLHAFCGLGPNKFMIY